MQTFADFTFTMASEVKIYKTANDGIEIVVDGALLEHVRIRVPKIARLLIDHKIGVRQINE